MRDGALDPGHGEEVLLGLLDALGNRPRYFLGLAVADADAAVAVPDHHQRGEAEPAAALHDLGHPVDGHHALDVVALLLGLAAATTIAVTAATLPGRATAALGSSHIAYLRSLVVSETQAGLAGAV